MIQIAKMFLINIVSIHKPFYSLMDNLGSKYTTNFLHGYMLEKSLFHLSNPVLQQNIIMCDKIIKS